MRVSSFIFLMFDLGLTILAGLAFFWLISFSQPETTLGAIYQFYDQTAWGFKLLPALFMGLLGWCIVQFFSFNLFLARVKLGSNLKLSVKYTIAIAMIFAEIFILGLAVLWLISFSQSDSIMGDIYQTIQQLPLLKIILPLFVIGLLSWSVLISSLALPQELNRLYKQHQSRKFFPKY